MARGEEGTQLVEMAIVTPVLIVILAGLSEFGLYLHAYTTLVKATRAGARYASTLQTKCGDDPGTRHFVVYGTPVPADDSKPAVKGLSTENVEIKCCPANLGSLPQVEVKIVGYEYKPIFNLGALIGAGSIAFPLGPSTKMVYVGGASPPLTCS
jgi:hypothetical protein